MDYLKNSKPDTPILKVNWERFQDHIDLDLRKAEEMLLPFTDAAIDELTLFAEGCSNSNYKVTFQDKSIKPVVIRIYMREHSAMRLEAALYKLVHDKIPVPNYLYLDKTCQTFPFPYAIIEWVEGTLMRDIVLSGDETDISQCTFEAGCYVDQLRRITLPERGFFQDNLEIRAFTNKEEYLPFVFNLLENPTVQQSLGKPLVKAISRLIKWNAILLATEREPNLTHADYDPSNLIFKKIDGRWQLVALLDWEFSFSGSYLLDMGMMLRYSHKLPEVFEKQFIAGIQSNGFKLSRYWKKKTKLLDILSLLYLANINPLTTKPNLNQDIIGLLNYTVDNWKSF